MENKAILSFLYLIANSPCVDIRAISIKFLNFFMRSETNVYNEYDLCAYVSNSLNSQQSNQQQSTTGNVEGQKKYKSNLNSQ